MTGSQTPETDALISVGLENADRECVPAEFGRKLEQERNEARFLLKAAQSALDAIHLEVGVWIKTMKENTD
jgi:hypothetical protein